MSWRHFVRQHSIDQLYLQDSPEPFAKNRTVYNRLLFYFYTRILILFFFLFLLFKDLLLAREKEIGELNICKKD